MSVESKSDDISAAIEFATKFLAPRARANSAFLSDLEQTMALLCFPPQSLAPPLEDLLSLNMRRQVAAKVNESILVEQGITSEAKIRGLVRLWKWGESKLTNEGVQFPPFNTNEETNK